VTLGMHLLLTRTQLGSKMLAVAEDSTAAQLMGIRPDTMQAIAWAIAAGATGLAGALIATFFYIVPTVGETVPGYEMSVWYGAFGPAGMPRPIVDKLNAEISRILFLPDVKQKMADIAVEVAKLTPEELGELTRKDAEKWGRIIKELGITAQ